MKFRINWNWPKNDVINDKTTSFYLFLPFWSKNIDSIIFFPKHVLLHLKSITKFVFCKIWLNQYFCLKMAKIDKMTSFCHQWRRFWVNFMKIWKFQTLFFWFPETFCTNFVLAIFWLNQYFFMKIGQIYWKLWNLLFFLRQNIKENLVSKLLREKKSGPWLNYVFLDLDSQMVIDNKKNSFRPRYIFMTLDSFSCTGWGAFFLNLLDFKSIA